MRIIAVMFAAAVLGASGASALPCGKPGALGVSRTITVNPNVTPAVGRNDYGASLPLAPGEVVLTFDDGPRPPYTNQVLKALADECLRATFFMVGRQANAYPQTARQVLAAGHTIGSHSQNHPLSRLSFKRAAYEIDTGIASVGAALGSTRRLAPFYRFPGLYRTREAEAYLRERGIMAWSVDVDSNDWKHNNTDKMLESTVARLKARRGGILLMHDVKPRTARVLPKLIAMLKARGLRIVHVVPSGGLRPAQFASRHKLHTLNMAHPARGAAVTDKAADAPGAIGWRNARANSFESIFTAGGSHPH